MKIKKFLSIRGYKSFGDYSWANFMRSKGGNTPGFAHCNVIFGENSAGKSAVCEILKSLSGDGDIALSVNVAASVSVDDKKYEFSGGKWSETLPAGCVLFFDSEFINRNVHTHGRRENAIDKGGHTQNIGKLILDLDDKTNTLNNEIKDAGHCVSVAETANLVLLNGGSAPSTEEIELLTKFGLLRTIGDNEHIGESKFALCNVLTSVLRKRLLEHVTSEEQRLSAETAIIESAMRRLSEISAISLAIMPALAFSISDASVYREVFGREVVSEAHDEAHEDIEANFIAHRSLIEAAKDELIAEDSVSRACPICMQPLANAKDVVDYYRSSFDHSYDEAKKKWLLSIDALLDEVRQISRNANDLLAATTACFGAIEKASNVGAPNVYDMAEKENFIRKASVLVGRQTSASALISSLESLKRIDARKELFSEKVYAELSNVAKDCRLHVASLAKLVSEKNGRIEEYKKSFADASKTANDLASKRGFLSEAKSVRSILDNNRDALVRAYEKNKSEAVFWKKYISAIKIERDQYVEATLGKSVVDDMNGFLKFVDSSFALDFFDPPTAITKDYPFSFTVKDSDSQIRDFKVGLSEGERQMISLALFFALAKKTKAPNGTGGKIVVFDDPVTSLDAANLKLVADYISTNRKIFGQVFVFTHHALFFKYLSKFDFAKFGIMRNGPSRGGSFIYLYASPNEPIEQRLKGLDKEIAVLSAAGSMNPQRLVLEYGQYLRLAVERLVKNDILMWNKDKMNEMWDELKKGRNRLTGLSDDDIDELKRIYGYCNWSNLVHADQQESSSLQELKKHIDKYLAVRSKAHKASGTLPPALALQCGNVQLVSGDDPKPSI